MIIEIHGDILRTTALALVNPVNCRGVMGRGLALQIKETFPEVLEPYRAACRDGRLRPGRVLLTPTRRAIPRHVVHFPTKDDWRQPATLAFIDAGLADLRATLARESLASIAIPPLGCGLGGLAWHDVQPLIEKHLADSPCAIQLYPPQR